MNFRLVLLGLVMTSSAMAADGTDRREFLCAPAKNEPRPMQMEIHGFITTLGAQYGNVSLKDMRSFNAKVSAKVVFVKDGAKSANASAVKSVRNIKAENANWLRGVASQAGTEKLHALVDNATSVLKVDLSKKNPVALYCLVLGQRDSFRGNNGLGNPEWEAKNCYVATECAWN